MSSADIHVTFTFQWVNGTLVPVATWPAASGTRSGLSGNFVQAILLGLLFVIGFVSSTLLVGTIWSSLTLHRLPFNTLLMSLGVVCLFECLANLAASVVYLIAQEWDFGFILCNLNSFFMEVAPPVYTLVLLTLAVDRARAMRDPSVYKKSLARASGRHKCYVLAFWVVAAAAASPLLYFFKNWPFPDRLSCQVMDPYSMVYGVASGAALYLLPWLGVIVAMLFIQRYISSEKRKERRAMRGQQAKFSTHTAFFFHNAHLWNELRNVMLVTVLLIVYLVFMAPYIVRVKVDQIMQGYDYAYYENLTSLLIETPSFNSSLLSNITTVPANATNGNSTGESGEKYLHRGEGFVYDVNEGHLNELDTAFVWLRYIHAVVVPLLIFAIHKDLRKKTKELLCGCVRPNSVENASPRPVSLYLRRQRRELQKQKKKFKNITNFNIPVLYATSEGLHLRVVDSNFSALDEHKVESTIDEGGEAGIKAQWTVDPEFVTEFCDLTVPKGGQAANMIDRRKSLERRQSKQSFGETHQLVDPRASDEGFHDEKAPLISSSPRRRKKTSSAEQEKKIQFNPTIETIPNTPMGSDEHFDSGIVDQVHKSGGRRRPSRSPSPAKRASKGRRKSKKSSRAGGSDGGDRRDSRGSRR